MVKVKIGDGKEFLCEKLILVVKNVKIVFIFSEVKLVTCPLKSIFRTVALENQVSCVAKMSKNVLKLIFS